MEKQSAPSLNAMLSVGFRPFFLLACLFASSAMALWAAFWSGVSIPAINPVGGMVFWHAHELVMGFVLAVVFGFLLTAVQNWTGQKTTTPLTLGLLSISWVLARAVMLFGNDLPNAYIVAICLLPTFASAVFIALPIVRKRMWRNLFAPISLFFLCLIDGAILSLAGSQFALISSLYLVAILFISLLVSVIGGRVIPMFIANRLSATKAVEPKAVFLLSIVPLPVVIALQFFQSYSTVLLISGILYCVLFVAHSLRLAYWFNRGMLKHPMLWSLWLFYAFLPVGFLCLGIKGIIPDTALSANSVALHVLTIGGISGIICTMLSRVSLGHTGRVITHDGWIVTAFILLIVSLALRTVMIATMGFSVDLVTYSAFSFAAAFGLIFLRFAWVWITPRPDSA